MIFKNSCCMTSLQTSWNSKKPQINQPTNQPLPSITNAANLKAVSHNQIPSWSEKKEGNLPEVPTFLNFLSNMQSKVAFKLPWEMTGSRFPFKSIFPST